MPTILDSFLVTFGIDSKPYKAGNDEIRREDKKTREQIHESDKGLQAGAKRSGESIGKLKGEVTGLLLAFAGASSIKSFFGDLISGDAATGRLAANLGVATTELGAWQAAAKQAGGSAADANAVFKMLTSSYEDFHLRGQAGPSADLIQLGVTDEDWQRPTKALLAMAAASEKMDRREFYNRAAAIGIPDSVITTLVRGRKATEEYIAGLERETALHKGNADDAAAFESALASLQTRLQDGMRPALYAAVGGLLAFTNNADVMNAILPTAVGLMGALAVSVIAATWPFLALAAAIGGAVAAYQAFARHRDEDKDTQAATGDTRPRQSRMSAAVRRFFGLSTTPPPGVLPAYTDAEVAAGRTGRPGAGGGAAPATGDDAAYLRKGGLREDQILGVQAGIAAEGGGLGMAANGAFGIGQWRGPRLAALKKRYGNAPTRQEQLEFLVSELKGGDRGGAAVFAASGATATMEAYIKSFMRPGPGTAGDLDRGNRYLAKHGATVAGKGGRGSSSSSVDIGTITVYSNATDPEPWAKEVGAQLKRRLNTVHANTGTH